MITQEIVCELIDYELETGKLMWRERDRRWFLSDQDWQWWNKRFARKEAFITQSSQGYFRGKILGKLYLAHRIIWLYINGKWPEQIDHINHDRGDNRLINLREASIQENQKNQSKSRKNVSGHTGIYFDKRTRKWRSYIKNMYLGYFDLFEDAVSARKEAEIKYDFHENHGV
jgi:hypothetical protein